MTKPASTNKNIVSLIDFAETFLDLAGASIPAEMQGRSLLPLLRGEQPSDWRSSLYYHYYEFPVPHRVRPHYGVVTDRYKLIHYYAPDVDEWELLDRLVDPLETKSFYNDPQYQQTVTELKSELKRLKVQVKDDQPTPRKAFGDALFEGEATPNAKSNSKPKATAK